MPLQPHTVEIPLAVGTDQHSDPKQAQKPGTIRNMVVDRAGELVMRKPFNRYTMTALQSSSQINRAQGVFEYGDEPVLIGEHRGSGTGSSAQRHAMMLGWSPNLSRWVSSNEGGIPFSLNVRRTSERHLKIKTAQRDVAYSGNGYMAIVYNTEEPTSKTRLEIWDITASRLLHQVDFSVAMTQVRCEFIDNTGSATKKLFAVGQGTSKNLRVITWDSNTPTTAPAAETNLGVTRTENATHSFFAMTTLFNVAAAKLDLVVVYKEATTNDMIIEAITGANVARWTTVRDDTTFNPMAGDLVAFPIRCLSAGTTRLMVAYWATKPGLLTPTIYTLTLEDTGAAATGPNEIYDVGEANPGFITGAGCLLGSQGQAYSDTTTAHQIFLAWHTWNGSAPVNYVTRWSHIDYSGVLVGSVQIHYNTRVVGGAFEDKGRLFCTLAPDKPSKDQYVYFLAEFTRGNTTNPTFIGRYLVNTGAYDYNDSSHLIPPCKEITTSYQTPTHQFGFVGAELNDILSVNTSASNAAVHTLAICELDFANPRIQVAASGRDRIVAAGRVWLYDGRAQELGFDVWPEVESLSSSGALGFLSASKIYGAHVTYDWWDRHGQRHRSAISALKSVTSSADTNDKLSATTQTILMSDPDKRSRTRLSLYRTIGDGDVFYFGGQNVPSENFRENDVTQQTLLLQDGESDANVADNEALYTDGGEVENIAPPASNIILAHKNRVFLVPCEDRTAIWFSKEREAGIGCSFSDALILRVAEGGDIVALAALDDNIVVFKRNSISMFGGQGPNKQGFGAFTNPQRLNTPIGCRDPNSVVTIDDGVIFKSDKGFYLLDRAGGTHYIGAGAESHNSIECVAAVNVQKQSRVYFVHTSAVNTIQVYDYLHKVWTEIDIDSSLVFFNQNHACALPSGDLVLVDDSGDAWLQDMDGATQYRDNNSAEFPVNVVTPWVRTGGISGFQRVWNIHLEGVFPSSGSIVVGIYYDDESVAAQTVTHTLTASTGNELRIKPARQKCKAIKLDITYDPTTDSEFRISKATLECGVKGGKLNRVKAAQTK